MVVAQQRNPSGRLTRVTVAVWEKRPDDEKSGGWRLDRVRNEDPMIGHRQGFELAQFELVDERDPSRIHEDGRGYSPIWIEREKKVGGPDRGEWFLTTEWYVITDERREFGARPVYISEKMIGLQICLFGSLKRGFLFENMKSDSNWMLAPYVLDEQILDGAQKLDEHVANVNLGAPPTQEDLSKYLGGNARRRHPEQGNRSTITMSLLNGDELVLHYSERYVPRWSAHPLDRTIKGPTLGGLLWTGLREGLFTLAEPSDKRANFSDEDWLERNVEPPKLLLDEEEIDLYRMLGEEIPLLWSDERFFDWASENAR